MSDIKENTQSLIEAAYCGKLDELRRLIPLPTPKHNDSEALQLSVIAGHRHCMDMLYPISNPVAAVEVLKVKYRGQPEIWSVLEERIATDLNTLLSQHVESPSTTKSPRKM